MQNELLKSFVCSRTRAICGRLLPKRHLKFPVASLSIGGEFFVYYPVIVCNWKYFKHLFAT